MTDSRPDYPISRDLATDTTAAADMLRVACDGGAGPCPIFSRGGALVEPVRGGGLATLGPDRLRDVLSQVARWCTVKRTREGPVLVDSYPPREVCASILSRSSWPSLPPLAACVSHPWIRCDGPDAGRIVSTPGYDAPSQTWGEWDPELGHHVASIVAEMTPGDALEQLDDMLHDFPFVDGLGGPHHSAAIAAWLTAVARPGIAGNVPLWIVDASIRGSGKGKLCDVVLLSVYPTPTPRAQWPTTDEEADKRLASLALAGVDRVLVDNLGTALGSPSLDAAITAGAGGYQARILGKSQIVSLPLRPFWCANGNNVQIKGDMDRRVLVSRLRPDTPNPENRTGLRYPRLEAAVVERRPALLAAALRLAQHGVRNPGPSVGSFETWSRVIRGATHAMGLADPWESGAEIRSQHSDDSLTAIVDAWHAAYGRAPTTGRDLANDLDQIGPQDHNADALRALRDALFEVAADSNQRGKLSLRRLGSWLGRNRDRFVVGADGKVRQIVAPVDGDGARVRHRHGLTWAVVESGDESA